MLAYLRSKFAPKPSPLVSFFDDSTAKVRLVLSTTGQFVVIFSFHGLTPMTKYDYYNRLCEICRGLGIEVPDLLDDKECRIRNLRRDLLLQLYANTKNLNWVYWFSDPEATSNLISISSS
jgi:hypothetical protein